jgi:hypothetical protein
MNRTGARAWAAPYRTRWELENAQAQLIDLTQQLAILEAGPGQRIPAVGGLCRSIRARLATIQDTLGAAYSANETALAGLAPDRADAREGLLAPL